ncbi:MAG: YceI family protein [Thermoanaerobaculia bacterium]|nr:YceI family protein [Thermoanaerobaculia bacterium]
MHRIPPKLLLASLLLALLLTPGAFAQPIEFGIDAAHSAVSFKVRHFFTQVPGHFDTFDGAIVYDPAKPESSRVEMTIQAASIDTGNENRDQHLRSADFFEVETYPTVRFESVSVTAKGDGELEVLGDFTLHGKTKRMTVPVSVLGLMRGEQARAGFSAEFTIDRKEFGVSWNRALDNGGTILGDEVKVTIDLEVVEKKAESAG